MCESKLQDLGHNTSNTLSKKYIQSFPPIEQEKSDSQIHRKSFSQLCHIPEDGIQHRCVIAVQHQMCLYLRIHAVEHKKARPHEEEADKHPPVVFTELLDLLFHLFDYLSAFSTIDSMISKHAGLGCTPSAAYSSGRPFLSFLRTEW